MISHPISEPRCQDSLLRAVDAAFSVHLGVLIMLNLPCQLNSSGFMWQWGKNTRSDFTIKKIPSVIHVQSSFLPRQANIGLRRFTQWFMTKLCGTAVVWMSTVSLGDSLWRAVPRGDATLSLSAMHMILHIWGEGTVRSPVGLILLMPPSRMQTLGYFIFTRWAANWKKRSCYRNHSRVSPVPGFCQTVRDKGIFIAIVAIITFA